MKMFPSLCPSQALAPLPDLGDKQSSPVFQKTVAAQVQVDLAPGRSGLWESLLLGKEPLRHPSVPSPSGHLCLLSFPRQPTLVMEHQLLGP